MSSSGEKSSPTENSGWANGWDVAPSRTLVYSIRLRPGQEILTSLQTFVKEKRIKSAYIVTCVGSVTKASLRFAQKPDNDLNDALTFRGHYEICSLVGTLDEAGGSHLHITLGRDDGSTVSGHVLGDLTVFTTAEIVLGVAQDHLYQRVFDNETGFGELTIDHHVSQG